MCPATNYHEDGTRFGEKCPFCETADEARQAKYATQDEVTKKKYSDVEFMYRPKDMWVVRCIERGHEEDGVKFWMFPHSKKNDGVFDKMMNLYRQRNKTAKARGEDYNIFSLNNGQDLILTLSRTSDGKTSVQVVDEGVRSPLTQDYEQGIGWVNDTKRWEEVYTVKPYEFMAIICARRYTYV